MGFEIYFSVFGSPKQIDELPPCGVVTYVEATCSEQNTPHLLIESNNGLYRCSERVCYVKTIIPTQSFGGKCKTHLKSVNTKPIECVIPGWQFHRFGQLDRGKFQSEQSNGIPHHQFEDGGGLLCLEVRGELPRCAVQHRMRTLRPPHLQFFNVIPKCRLKHCLKCHHCRCLCPRHLSAPGIGVAPFPFIT